MILGLHHENKKKHFSNFGSEAKKITAAIYLNYVKDIRKCLNIILYTLNL